MFQNELIEYVRKSGRKPKRDDNGNIVVKGAGTGRTKKGVLFCGILPDLPDQVSIGFSLCSPMDEFDVVNGSKEPGFGLELAQARADKWANFTGFFVQTSWTEDELDNGDIFMFENPEPKTVVEIPPSICNQLASFIGRCRRYYKDKEFPEWVEKFEAGEPETCNIVGIGHFDDDDIFIPVEVD